MVLVQFWLIVEGFKDPLDGEEDENEESQGTWDKGRRDGLVAGEDEKAIKVDADKKAAEAVAMAREDMRAVWEGYFEVDMLGDEIVEKFGGDVRKFVLGRDEKGLTQARKRLVPIFL